MISKDGGRRLDWLTYSAAAVEGQGDEMAARGYGDAVGKLGVTVYLCVDLLAYFEGEHGKEQAVGVCGWIDGDAGKVLMLHAGGERLGKSFLTLLETAIGEVLAIVGDFAEDEVEASTDAMGEEPVQSHGHGGLMDEM